MKVLVSCMLVFLTLNVMAMRTKTIDVDITSPTFDVLLAANPTTGYQWTLSRYDEKRFELIGSQYIRPEAERIGQGGEMAYTFKLQSEKSYPDKTTLLFKHARPWDPKSATHLKVIIQFKKPGPDKN